jgi:hypothetical protein
MNDDRIKINSDEKEICEMWERRLSSMRGKKKEERG